MVDTVVCTVGATPGGPERVFVKIHGVGLAAPASEGDDVVDFVAEVTSFTPTQGSTT